MFGQTIDRCFQARFVGYKLCMRLIVTDRERHRRTEGDGERETERVWTDRVGDASLIRCLGFVYNKVWEERFTCGVSV